MNRVPASVNSFKGLIKTSVKDILYQWVIASKFRICHNSLKELINGNNWEPVSYEKKNSRSVGSELAWLVQQHIEFLQDIPYEV